MFEALESVCQLRMYDSSLRDGGLPGRTGGEGCGRVCIGGHQAYSWDYLAMPLIPHKTPQSFAPVYVLNIPSGAAMKL